jgi:hypothetical protein
MMARMDRLEARLHVQENGHLEPDEEGHWIGSDFSI